MPGNRPSNNNNDKKIPLALLEPFLIRQFMSCFVLLDSTVSFVYAVVSKVRLNESFLSLKDLEDK